MTSEPDYQVFDDGSIMVTIDGNAEPPGPPGSGLDSLERALEKRLAEECACNQHRIPVLRETFARLKSRTNSREQNFRDYYRIVHYLLYNRVDPDPPEPPPAPASTRSTIRFPTTNAASLPDGANHRRRRDVERKTSPVRRKPGFSAVSPSQPRRPPVES